MEVCSDFSMVLQRVIVLLSVSALLAASVREEEDIGDLEQEQDMEMEEERKEQSIYVTSLITLLTLSREKKDRTMRQEQ